MEDDEAPEPGLKLDTSVSHSARIWNYWLGGKDNYAVAREAGDKVGEFRGAARKPHPPSTPARP